MVFASIGGNAGYCPLRSIGCKVYITARDGSFLTCKASGSYLGSYLDATGAGGPEICRRLGEAKGQFDKLARIWRYSTLHTQQKIWIFQTCVVSKLLCCLHTMWLNKAELRKIHGFQAKRLRSILRIHLRTSVVYQMQPCCRQPAASACPPS